MTLSLDEVTALSRAVVAQERRDVDRTFAIDFVDAGVEAFAFTFG